MKNTLKKFSLIAILVFFVYISVNEFLPNEINLYKINLPFETLEKERTTLCYSDENTIIMAIRHINSIDGGPVYTNSEKIYMWDYTRKKAKVHKYNVNSDIAIYSAVPYEDGILYVDYEYKNNLYEWEIVFQNDSGRMTIDEGRCLSEENTPYIKKIDGFPIYLCEHNDNGDTLYKIMKIEDYKATCVDYIPSQYKLVDTIFFTNGKEFCLRAVNGDESIIIYGNLSGIKNNYSIEGWIHSFGITQNYLFLSERDINYNNKIVRVDLKNGQVFKKEYKEVLYRITGGTGSNCLCVNSNYDLFAVNLNSLELNKEQLSTEIVNSLKIAGAPIALFSAGKNSFIMDYCIGNYFEITFK